MYVAGADCCTGLLISWVPTSEVAALLIRAEAVRLQEFGAICGAHSSRKAKNFLAIKAFMLKVRKAVFVVWN